MKKTIQSIADRDSHDQRRHHFGAQPRCDAERIGPLVLLRALSGGLVEPGAAARSGKALIEIAPIIWPLSRFVTHFHTLTPADRRQRLLPTLPFQVNISRA
ncbi:hypothetical protein Acry_0398 [Acidiphilium cryptum JF-5]|uniref:Uncharacterized protein n=1 Tax=Acidiphilium cryptum (strain JF-5) TaxID=349163 RepID=A5FVJ1_ACICJ|nr:hypothetical protein Acry_0398 [Acidiphilium cryptum JF-5]